MTSFTDVTTGNPTLASDINQYADRLNGTTSAGIIVSGGNSVFVPYTGSLSATPGGTAVMFAGLVSGDAHNRIELDIRSDGYGMIQAGNGISITGNLYAQSGGWKTDQSFTIVGALTVQGSTNIAGLNVSNTASLSSSLTVAGTTSLGDVLQINRTLSGSNKTFQVWNATDGKNFQAIIETGGFFTLWDGTDAVASLRVHPINGVINPAGQTIFISAAASDPASSFTVQNTDVWIKF